MNVVLLRVGIDTGCGGIHSPLFEGGTFKFVPIPDSKGLDERTYGNFVGRERRLFSEYFPQPRRERIASQAMHVDPEFDTFTYGEACNPKPRLPQLCILS